MNAVCVFFVVSVAAVVAGCGVGKQMIRKYIDFLFCISIFSVQSFDDITVRTRLVNIRLRKKFSRIRGYLRKTLVMGV